MQSSRPAAARQHAIITGGSSGIGRAVATLLGKHGMHISLLARDPLRLEQTRSTIAQHAHPDQHIATFSVDVADRTAVEQATTAAVAQSGPPALLIASAGMSHPGRFADLPAEVFERTMAVNYFGTLYAVRAVLPHMRKQHSGQIVLISSGAGLIGIYGYTAYSASKFALRGLAESLRMELRPFNIAVSIVYPPDTDTPQLTDENRLKPYATRQITRRGGLMQAPAVAQAILQGIERRAFTITPGLEMTLLARLHSLLAPVLNWHFDRIVRRCESEE
jgi:3-dehydrosphinganine reductase